MGENSTTPQQLKPTQDARMWAMFCHLAGLVGFVIPFGNIIGPLVIWILKKDEFPYVDEQGKEALNFGILLLIALGLFGLIMIVIAAVKANSGEKFHYPLAIRFFN